MIIVISMAYIPLIIFWQKEKKIMTEIFLLKIVIVYFKKKKKFNCKNDYKCNKLANFWLNIISKIKSKMLIIISYISLR